MGSLLADVRFELAFALPAALTLIVFPFASGLRPGSLPVNVPGGQKVNLLRTPGVGIGVAIASSHSLLVGVVDATWSRMLTDLGADLRFIGLGFLVTIGPAVFVAPLGGRWADRTNPIQLAMIALVLEVIAVGALGFATSPWVLLLLGAGGAVIYGVLIPSALGAVAKALPPERFAAGLAIVEGTGLVLAFVGAVSAPAIYESFGPRWLYLGVGAWFGVVAIITWATRSRWQQVFGPAAQLSLSREPVHPG